MSTPNPSIGANDFILQESAFSRDTVTVIKGSGKLAAGSIVMRTDDGKYQQIDMRLRTMPAVLCAAVDATLSDQKVSAIVREATVDPSRLRYPAAFSTYEQQNVASYVQMFLMRRFTQPFASR